MAVSFLLLLLLLLFLTSSRTNTQPLLLPLTHTLSLLPPSNSTQHVPHHLLSSLRSAARFRSRRQLPLPLSAGSDYTLSLSIASTTVSLYLDTGSDLLWFPCSPFECILCEGKPFFPPSSSPPPSSSLPIPCSSPLCSAAHSSLPTPDLCSVARCPLDSIETSSCSSPCPQLYYAYADGSILAHLRHAPLSLPNLPSSLPNFTFACAHSSLAEPLGVAGFGRGPLSLPNQLALLSPSLASRFSYCLISHSFLPSRLRRPSPLILGRSPSPSFSYTPLLSNPSHQYLYSIALLSLSVAAVRVPASPSLAAVDRAGFGGMAVDSGTTFTMLPAATHRRLAAEFARQMQGNGFRRAAAAEERTGLGPCYAYGSGREEARRVPAVGMHFAGNASVWLPTRNYFMGFESEGERVGCFMVMSAGDDDGDDGDGGPAGTLGNFQQQGMEVLYDLEMGRVGFARRRCAALWDSVTRG